MLSKIIGPYGVVRNQAITIVKVAQTREPEWWGEDEDTELEDFYPGPSLSAVVDGLKQVLEDVINRGLRRRAVVQMSFGLDGINRPFDPIPELDRDSGWRALYRIIKQLEAEGVVIVVASGNEGDLVCHRMC